MIERYYPEVASADDSQCGASWNWHNLKNTRDQLNFWLIRSGSGRWRTSEKTFQLKPGDCFIQRMWEESWGDAIGGRNLNVLWANFRLRTSNGKRIHLQASTQPTSKANPKNTIPAMYRYIKAPEFITELATRMIDAYHEPSSPNASHSWMRSILEELTSLDQHSASRIKTGSHSDTIEAVCHKIRQHPENNHSISALAKSVFLSPGHFTRIFNQVKGMPPQTFITQTKINAAKSLLRISNVSVTQIAERLGYHDVFHFSKRFREQTGLPPTAFRKLK